MNTEKTNEKQSSYLIIVIRSIFNYIFPKKSKWIDINMFDDKGKYKLIQMRYRLDNNKKEFRIIPVGFVNDHTVKLKIYENILLERM